MSGPSSELSFAQNKIVRAGAGAGKTTDLVENIISVVREYHNINAAYPQLVVTTFTRKATQELRERLVLRALELNDAELLKVVTSPSMITISTIHGVLRQFLSRFGNHIGLVPNFRVISDAEDLADRKRIMKDILVGQFRFQRFLQEETSFQLLNLLDKYVSGKLANPSLFAFQREHFEQHKSTEIRVFLAGLRSHAYEILGETENEKWRLFAEQLAKLSQLDPEDQDTFSRLKTFRQETNKPRNAGKPKPVSEEFAKVSTDFWSSFKKWVEQPDWDDSFLHELELRNSDFQQFGDEFAIEYFQFKMSKAVLRQSDLELLSLELIRRHPDVATGFATDIHHWFVDEFQDTSPIQLELLDHLSQDTPIYIVGDPQQSIYLFRGARSEVFANRWQQSAETERVVKMKNYRSRPELMSFLNAIVTKVSEQFEPMQLKDEDKNDAAVAQLSHLSSMEEELELLGKNIQSLITSGVAPSEIAVLSRKRSEIRLIAKQLSDLGVPFQTFVPAGFFDRLEIIDSLNLLKFLCQPHDDEALVGLMRSPWFQVPDGRIATYCANLSGSLWKTLTAMKAAEEDEAIARLIDLISQANSKGIGHTWQMALSECGLLDTCSHHDLSGRREANIWKLICDLRKLEGQPGFRYLDYVNQTLSEFSDDEVEEGDAVAAFEANRVNVMTAHKSKGLQFSYVFIPFCGEKPNLSTVSDFTLDEECNGFSLSLPVEEAGKNKKLKPIASRLCRDRLNKRELEENERVFYVALTRAKFCVYLSWSKIGKSSWADLISPHLSELQSHHVEWVKELEPSESEVIQNDSAQSIKLRSPWRDDRSDAQSLSVTELTAGQTSKISVEQIERREKGTRIHRLLESLKTQPLEDLLSGLSGDEYKALNNLKNIKEVPLFKLIEYGEVEWGFSFRTENTSIDGQIDLWGIVDGICYIVDYKTGDPRYQENAFKQLNYYADCLSSGYVSEPIKLVALYPLHGQCEVVDYQD